MYDSWFGNTKIVAETIAEGLREAKGADEACARHVNTIVNGEIPDYDIILLGSPNHMGRPTRSVMKQIDRLTRVDLSGRRVGVFDTCFSNQMGLATKEMATKIHNEIPHIEPFSPELSVVVRHTRGPIAEGELIRVREFGEKLAGVFPFPQSELLWDRG